MEVKYFTFRRRPGEIRQVIETSIPRTGTPEFHQLNKRRPALTGRHDLAGAIR